MNARSAAYRMLLDDLATGEHYSRFDTTKGKSYTVTVVGQFVCL